MITESIKKEALEKCSTLQIMRELEGREAVDKHRLGPEDRALIIFQGPPGDQPVSRGRLMADGPATLLVVTD